MKTRTRLVMCVCAAVLLVPSASRADWLASPFVGVSFGGDAQGQGQPITYGGSIGYMGARVIGFEIDFGHSPDLLDDSFIDNSSATTLMANLIVGVPIGATRGARPYVSGGAGLLRTRVESADGFFDIDDNSFGINVGAGVHVFLTDNVGFKVDGRYFRSVQDSNAGDNIDFDLGSLDFWRATVGVSFRF